MGILALLGSGEFTDKIVEVDKFLLKKIKSPKVAIIPTAAGEEDTWPNWIKMGEDHYRKLGVSARGFPVIDKKSAENPKILKGVQSCNFFVFSGGDPGFLFDVLDGSLLWNIISNLHTSGAVLVGASAGAMVMGKKVWSRVKKFDKTGALEPWTGGLNLVDFGVIPHFDYIVRNFSKEKIDGMRKILPIDIKVVGIEENTAYIKIDDSWRVMGEGQVYDPAIF